MHSSMPQNHRLLTFSFTLSLPTLLATLLLLLPLTTLLLITKKPKSPNRSILPTPPNLKLPRIPLKSLHKPVPKAQMILISMVGIKPAQIRQLAITTTTTTTLPQRRSLPVSRADISSQIVFHQPRFEIERVELFYLLRRDGDGERVAHGLRVVSLEAFGEVLRFARGGWRDAVDVVAVVVCSG